VSVTEVGVAQNNREQMERAGGLMYEALQQALVDIGRGKKVTLVQVRVPVHGIKFGVPKVMVERE
jgi:hypothetical protein